MIKSATKPLIFALMVAGLLAWSAPISAEEVRCANKEWADKHLPSPPKGCQPVYVSASGKSGITKGSAHRKAMEAWQDEVRNKYGERFMMYVNSRCQKEECVQSSMGVLGFMQRCTLSSYPCSPDAEKGQFDDTAVEAIQRMLNKCNFYNGKIDGIFGSKSMAAVEKFQRKYKLNDDGVPGEDTLEQLRKHCS